MLHQPKQLETLQVLRGLAAILVLLHHTSFLAKEKRDFEFLFGVFDFGYMGVDLFFVLSGFIIFYIHHKDIGQRSKFTSFIKKRFIRIYPVYWVVALAVLPLFFFLPNNQNVSDPFYVVKSLLLFPQADHPFVGVAWTLTHEVFFYFMFSLLICFRPGISYTIVISWLSITLGLFIFSPVLKLSNFWINFIFSPFNLEFLMGSLCAFIVLRFKKDYNFSKYLGFAILTLFWLFSYTGKSFPDVIGWGISSALIILGFSSRDYISNIKAPRLLKFIGDASYSIYLTHSYTLLAGHYLFSFLNFYRFGSLAFIALATIALIVGCIFHLLIEQKLIKYLRKRIENPKQRLGCKDIV
jgi:exopolysaccharide production protein ExoZ